MGLTNYNDKKVEITQNGTKITTTTNDDKTYTSRVYHSSDGTFLKGDVYRGDLETKDHSHYSRDKDGKSYSRDVIRSDIFK